MKHSRTSSSYSYERDFRELIETYTSNQKNSKKTHLPQENVSVGTCSKEEKNKSWLDGIEERASSESDDDITLPNKSFAPASMQKELSVEFLEDECDQYLDVDDLDGTF